MTTQTQLYNAETAAAIKEGYNSIVVGMYRNLVSALTAQQHEDQAVQRYIEGINIAIQARQLAEAQLSPASGPNTPPHPPH